MNDVELLSQAEHNTSHDEFQFTAKVTQKKKYNASIFLFVFEKEGSVSLWKRTEIIHIE
jgi:hypothetical protein